MSQPALFSESPWTVTALTRRIRQRLDSDNLLQDLWVQGEVSNITRPASGHVYFTLKDGSAAIRCVLWRATARQMPSTVRDGTAIEVHGRVSVYEAGGQYQLYADSIRLSGEGALYQEFLQLKSRLEAEGLFDAARKRSIPEFPLRIGLITSPSGAALQDVLHTIGRRMPLAHVIFAPAPVQGSDAPPALERALERVAGKRPQVILIVRGGGSIEDLWTFNDPNLVRAVARSAVPVICGIGHETDFTLCDFVADLRAPTPTAAAELATPRSMRDLLEELAQVRARMRSAAGLLTTELGNRLQSAAAQLRLVSPARWLERERQRLDDFDGRITSGILHGMQLLSARVAGLEHRMTALNPLAVLGRGYAVVARADDGQIISRIEQAAELMSVRVTDGEFRVRHA